MIKTLIVEDDPISRDFKGSCRKCDSTVKVTDSCGSVKQAIKKIEKLDPDLVFLDVELPDGSGFDLLKRSERSISKSFYYLTRQVCS